jgi:SAM-dependent methyltransferase
MTDAVCIICGNNDAAVTLYPATMTEDQATPQVFSARCSPDRLYMEMLRCTRCGLVFPRHFPDPSVLQGLYEDSTYLYDDMEPVLTKNYMRYVRWATKLLISQTQPWKAIDIGCGNGFMVKALQDAGFDAFGIEPSEDAVRKADPVIRSKLISGLADSHSLGHETYDLLTCFQTLDHMPDPLTFMGDCFAALKPGGVVLFINHDIASFTARILGKHCPMIDVVHTYLHTHTTMKTLFHRTGFRDISTCCVRSDYPLWFWWHMTPFQGAWKKNVLSHLRTFGIGNIPVPLYAGNIGLIARRPR